MAASASIGVRNLPSTHSNPLLSTLMERKNPSRLGALPATHGKNVRWVLNTQGRRLGPVATLKQTGPVWSLTARQRRPGRAPDRLESVGVRAPRGRACSSPLRVRGRARPSGPAGSTHVRCAASGRPRSVWSVISRR